MGILHGPNIVTDNLVLCLDAANTNSYPGSGQSWTDLVSSYDGTLTNGPTFSSTNGGSIVFDGTDDYISTTFGNGRNPTTNPVSYTLWIRTSTVATVTGYNEMYLVNGTWVGSYRAYFGYLYDGVTGKYYFHQGIGGSGWSTSAKWYAVVSNTWYHIGIVFTGSTCNFLVNGVQYGTKAYTSFTFNQGLQLAGTSYDLPNYAFTGNIVGVNVYNDALSTSEVLQNYDAHKGRFGL